MESASQRQEGFWECASSDENLSPEERNRLILLMREIAREEASEAIEEHLNDYVHEERPSDEVEVKGE